MILNVVKHIEYLESDRNTNKENIMALVDRCEFPECKSENTVWVCIDDNMETKMCRKHIRECNESGVMDVTEMEG